MKLATYKPRVVRHLDNLHQFFICGQASDNQALVFQCLTILIIKLITMTVPLDNLIFPI